MGNCDRCRARDAVRSPAKLRDAFLERNEHLRELAREEWRADMRQLRERQPAANETLDLVRGVDDAGAPGHETN